MSGDNTLDSTGRRTFLRAVGAGTATGVVVTGTGCTLNGDRLDAQLGEVTDATSEYSDPRAALDAGFQVMGPFVAGMGWHFINRDRVRAAVEDGFTPTEPQLLTYGDTGEGLEGLKLGSVEYAIPLGARDYTEENPPDLFDDEDEETWHLHSGAEHVLAVRGDPASEEFPESIGDVPPAERMRSTHWMEVAPGGSPDEPMFEPKTMLVGDLRTDGVTDARAVVDSSTHPDLLTLHAWVHHDNPDGVLAGHNSDLPSSPTP